jgi:hypothetical protein
MLRHERSAPIWLFSFVDLAFLLLIAFTQIGPRDVADALDLATLEIPRIQGPGNAADLPADGAVWQLRVHPVATPIDESIDHAPFVLVEPGTDPDVAERRGAAALGEALAVLDQRGEAKPILAPHRDARAEDLLVAVSLLDESWGGTRTAAVRPSPAHDRAAPDVLTDVASAPTEAR